MADRFHLFCNLTQALQRVLERLPGILLRVQVVEPPASLSASDDAVEPVGPGVSQAKEVAPGPPIKHEQQRQQQREKLKALFDAVRAAYERGLTKRAIARELGVTRTTVRRFLRAEGFPERAPRQRQSGLDSFREYLEKRWAEGCHNASQLCRELRQRGYRGQRSRVKEYVHPWRTKSSPVPSKWRRTLPNLRQVAFWLTKPPMLRNPTEQCWVEAVITGHPQVAAAEELAQQFRQVFKDQDSDALESWMVKSLASEIPELERFVAGLQRDFEAVVAAVEQHWSNGQVEGQVHRLKASSSARCTAVVGFCFYVDVCCPLDAGPLNTLPDLHQKCGRTFQVTTEEAALRGTGTKRGLRRPESSGCRFQREGLTLSVETANTFQACVAEQIRARNLHMTRQRNTQRLTFNPPLIHYSHGHTIHRLPRTHA